MIHSIYPWSTWQEKSLKESAFESYQTEKLELSSLKGAFVLVHCIIPLLQIQIMKSVFINTLTTKRGPRKICPFWDTVGNIVTKDEEKPDGLGNSSPLFHFVTLSPSGIEFLLAEITTFSTVNITHSLPLSISTVSLLNLYLILLFCSSIMPN